jgi:hypothetical protein
MANDLSAFKAEAWSKRIIQKLDKINVMLALVNRDYEGEIQGVGDTVWVRTPGNVTLSTYTKGLAISYQDLTPTKESMVINTAKYFAFNVDDWDKAQNDLSALDIYAQRAAVALNDEVEAELLSNYTAAAAANQITNGGLGIALTKSNIYQYMVEARTRLTKQNVPTHGRWMVVDPDTAALLLQAPEFVKATDLNDRVIVEGNLAGSRELPPGFLGRCAGFDIFESVNVPVASTDTFIPFGTRKAVSYAAQIREIEVLRLQTTFAWAVRGLLLHDSKVFAEYAKQLGYIRKD